MTDRPTDDELRRLLEGYRRPPDMPAESLWAAIEGSRTGPGETAREGGRARGVRAWLAVAAVASFALGGAAGYAIAEAGGGPGAVATGDAAPGPPGDVRVHRITWF